MNRFPVTWSLATCLVAGVAFLAFGQGEAAAQADAAAQLRALQAQVDQLSTRVTALDAMIGKQNRVITISGSRGDNDIVLRGNPATAHSLTVGDKDAVLNFRRITLTADEIALAGKKTITLKAPAITLDGNVDAKGSNDITVKGLKVRDN